jgi:ABC-type multidrug transport system permease subunit
MPKIMDNIAYLTPTGWAMRAISDLQLGLRFYNIIPHIFIIILFSVVFFTIGEYKNIKLERN